MDPHARTGHEECTISLFRLQRSKSFPQRLTCDHYCLLAGVDLGRYHLYLERD